MKHPTVYDPASDLAAYLRWYEATVRAEFDLRYDIESKNGVALRYPQRRRYDLNCNSTISITAPSWMHLRSRLHVIETSQNQIMDTAKVERRQML